MNSVIDVPFSQGTLAINSTEANAFKTRDIDVLMRFARVVDEGLSRLHDLRDLRAEVEERRANERRLKEAHRQLQDAQAQLLEAESLRVLVEAAGGAAHEISQPLQILTFSLNRFAADGVGETEGIALMLKQIERIAAVVRRMMAVQAYRTRDHSGHRIVSYEDAALDPGASSESV